MGDVGRHFPEAPELLVLDEPPLGVAQLPQGIPQLDVEERILETARDVVGDRVEQVPVFLVVGHVLLFFLAAKGDRAENAVLCDDGDGEEGEGAPSWMAAQDIIRPRHGLPESQGLAFQVEDVPLEDDSMAPEVNLCPLNFRNARSSLMVANQALRALAVIRAIFSRWRGAPWST